MRFADLIKPDFQGGVLTALAVNPLAVSTIFQGSTLKLMWQLFRQMGGPDSFGEAEENLGLATAIDQAGLTPEERAADAARDPVTHFPRCGTGSIFWRDCPPPNWAPTVTPPAAGSCRRCRCPIACGRVAEWRWRRLFPSGPPSTSARRCSAST